RLLSAVTLKGRLSGAVFIVSTTDACFASDRAWIALGTVTENLPAVKCRRVDALRSPGAKHTLIGSRGKSNRAHLVEFRCSMPKFSLLAAITLGWTLSAASLLAQEERRPEEDKRQRPGVLEPGKRPEDARLGTPRE